MLPGDRRRATRMAEQVIVENKERPRSDDRGLCALSIWAFLISDQFKTEY
jgi:hypothetical protein